MPANEPDGWRIAINLADLDRIDSEKRQGIFKNRLDLEKPIKVPWNDRFEVAIPFTCRLLDAAIICDMLRVEDRKNGDNPTRVYLFSPRTDWWRTPPNEVFSVVVRGKCVLSPQLFETRIEIAPSQPTPFTFGEE